jgi:hypothetical protein
MCYGVVRSFVEKVHNVISAAQITCPTIYSTAGAFPIQGEGGRQNQSLSSHLVLLVSMSPMNLILQQHLFLSFVQRHAVHTQYHQ